ncbi:MAG: NUDIX hydrolase, partial [Alphaproteobacteria bacterium]|nr:NUDIX hydrolase [Alphaproteobacteria bacterium]
RKLLWLPFEEAARRVTEPDLRKLLLAFRRQMKRVA